MAEFDQTSFNSIHPFLDKVTLALVAGLLREHQVIDGADLMKLVEKRSGPFNYKGSAKPVLHSIVQVLLCMLLELDAVERKWILISNEDPLANGGDVFEQVLHLILDRTGKLFMTQSSRWYDHTCSHSY